MTVYGTSTVGQQIQTCVNEKDSQLAQSLPVGAAQLLQRMQGRATVSYREDLQLVLMSSYLWVIGGTWRPKGPTDFTPRRI